MQARTRKEEDDAQRSQCSVLAATLPAFLFTFEGCQSGQSSCRRMVSVMRLFGHACLPVGSFPFPLGHRVPASMERARQADGGTMERRTDTSSASLRSYRCHSSRMSLHLRRAASVGMTSSGRTARVFYGVPAGLSRQVPPSFKFRQESARRQRLGGQKTQKAPAGEALRAANLDAQRGEKRQRSPACQGLMYPGSGRMRLHRVKL